MPGAAEILTERPEEFARLLTLEMGKLYGESLGEVALTAQIFAYYAENAESFLAPSALTWPAQTMAPYWSAPRSE